MSLRSEGLRRVAILPLWGRTLDMEVTVTVLNTSNEEGGVAMEELEAINQKKVVCLSEVIAPWKGKISIIGRYG
jgi:hypothetical protein